LNINHIEQDNQEEDAQYQLDDPTNNVLNADQSEDNYNTNQNVQFDISSKISTSKPMHGEANVDSMMPSIKHSKQKAQK